MTELLTNTEKSLKEKTKHKQKVEQNSLPGGGGWGGEAVEVLMAAISSSICCITSSWPPFNVSDPGASRHSPNPPRSSSLPNSKKSLASAPSPDWPRKINIYHHYALTNFHSKLFST